MGILVVQSRDVSFLAVFGPVSALGYYSGRLQGQLSLLSPNAHQSARREYWKDGFTFKNVTFKPPAAAEATATAAIATTATLTTVTTATAATAAEQQQWKS